MSTLDVQNLGLRDLIDPDASVERIAAGLGFTEGPVWRDGYLLFSDIPNNRIARWHRLAEGCLLYTSPSTRDRG